MRSLVVNSFGGPEVIELVDAPLPEPSPHQLRIRVAASSVNPIDLSTRAGRLVAAGLMVVEGEVGLGWDVAGTVDAVGAEVRTHAVGDHVVGLRNLLFAPGAHAEHVVLDASAVAPAPRSVPLVEAATLPLNALTADRALDLAALERGQTLLVTGAAGAVGGFVPSWPPGVGCTPSLWLARATEDLWPTWARRRSSLVRPPGPAYAPWYRAGSTPSSTPPSGIAAHDALRDGGTFVALVAPFAPPPIRGTRVVVQEVVADGARLAELSALVDAGHLTLRLADELPLEEAAKAHRLVEAGGQRGRVVLVP